MKKPVIAVVLGLVVAAFCATASAHEECTDNAACATGEVCYEGECSATCKADSDCPAEQSCVDATACVHDDADEGCSTAPAAPGHAFSLFGAALVAAAVRLARRRSRSPA